MYKIKKKSKPFKALFWDVLSLYTSLSWLPLMKSIQKQRNKLETPDDKLEKAWLVTISPFTDILTKFLENFQVQTMQKFTIHIVAHPK